MDRHIGIVLVEDPTRDQDVLAHSPAENDIASMRHVNVNTIEKHTDNLMRKFEVHERVRFARYATRGGCSRREYGVRESRAVVLAVQTGSFS